jgi:hypothetical protein
VGGTQFNDPLELKLGELEAKGTIEFADEAAVVAGQGERYDVAYMYVGLIQAEVSSGGNLEITAGAYGMGPPEIDTAVRFDEEAGANVRGWSLYLQKDSKKGNFDQEKKAYGFVVAQLKGGKLIGWLHEKITLEISERQNP